ncbi:MAG: phosphotransferase [Nitrospirota bacterium]|nr:phosphotransferase [Nitrospirota bacterium]
MNKFPINIFLPAAGLGERLRPATNHIPKPLLPVLGKPIIQGIAEKLTEVCDNKIGMNLHWKPRMLMNWAAMSPWRDRFTFFPEDPILGTGGALKNAESFLLGNHFIVHNSDILLDIDFAKLIETHLSSGNMATLVCHRLPELSNVVIDKQDQIIDVENPGASRPDPTKVADKVAYTGIAVYSPEILKFLPDGVSHATVAWIAASRAGHKVRAYDVTGAYWNDVGNPATYSRAVLDALAKDGETIYISPSASCGDIEADGYLAAENYSTVGAGAKLRNCIIMPGAIVTGEHRNRIIGPDYAIDLHESEMQPAKTAAETITVHLSDPLFAPHFASDSHFAFRTPHSALPVPAFLIGLGGSDRRYYRIRQGERSAVLMECRPDDPDFERHLVYTRFFESHAVPVPKLLASHHTAKRALFEDLGDRSLYAYLKLPRTADQIRNIYKSVLDVAVKLHSRATEGVGSCPLLQARIFDYEYLRWETNYFLDRFVQGYLGIDLKNRPELEEEFHRLARTVDDCPRTIIHRDFQSQNIMISDHTVQVIDFQGARMAPPAYDIASILWDPYYRLHDLLRDRLLVYYIEEMKKAALGFDEQIFRRSLIPCRLQRHMQALGAYGFLTMVKGKAYFRKHIPEAIRLLKEETAAVADSFPTLHRLAQSL